jgi:dTDP-4-dehydrorhamnose 3,5-epimerase
VKVVATDLPGVLIIESKVFGDERGFFYESYNERDFRAQTRLVDVQFVQDNHSRSARGVLRGLHYQIQRPQGKLVRATVGAVYDVVVDVRKSSPTFGKWLGFELSAQNKLSVWIPPGYAHGFLVTSDYAEFQYKTTEYWAPEHERCIFWSDPDLAIPWPLEGRPILARKDEEGRRLAEAEVYP